MKQFKSKDLMFFDCRRIKSTTRKSRRGGEGRLALWRARRMQLPGGGMRRPPARAPASTLAIINGSNIKSQQQHRREQCTKSWRSGRRGRNVTGSESSSSSSSSNNTGSSAVSGTGPDNDQIPFKYRKRDVCTYRRHRITVEHKQHLQHHLETSALYPRRKKWTKE